MAYKDSKQRAFEKKVYDALKDGLNFPLEFKSWLRAYLELNPPAFLPSDLAGLIHGTDIDVDSLTIDRLLAGDIAGDNVQVGVGSADDGSGNAIRDPSFVGLRMYHSGENTFRVDAITGDLFFSGNLGDTSILGATFAWGSGSTLKDDLVTILPSAITGFTTPVIVQAPTTTGYAFSNGHGIAWDQATNTGNTLICIVHEYVSAGHGAPTKSMTGWTLIGTKSNPATDVQSVMFMKANSNSRSGLESVSGFSTFGSSRILQLIEVSGLVDVSPKDAFNSLANAGSNSPSSGSSGTLAQANEWCLASLHTNNANALGTPTGGFTEDYEIHQNSTLSSTATTLTQTVSSTSAVTAGETATGSPSWVGLVVTFKLAALSVNAPASGCAIFVADAGGLPAVKSVDTGGNIHNLQTPAGVIHAFAGSSAPEGYLLCDGASLVRATYPALFSAIGTTYGAADGTHFNVPDLRGRVPVALDDMGGSDAGRLSVANTLGGSGGEEKHTLTVAELAGHHHGPGTLEAKGDQATNTTTGGTSNRITGNAGSGSHAADVVGSTGDTGSDATHNNMQPYILMNYIIKI